MNLSWQRFLLGAAFAVFAVWLGFDLAEGSYGVAMLAAAACGVAVLHYLLRLSVDTLVLGLVLLGYLIGNRGFAQLSLFPGLPALPAEVALALGGGWLVVKCALERRLPFELVPLHLSLLALLVVGAGRLVVDFPEYRFLALRDFATVYYAGFFYVAQSMAEDVRVRRFLRTCLLAGVLTIPVVFSLFQAFPEFFLSTLVVRSAPLIYIKSDVALPMAAAGIFLLHFDPLVSRRWWVSALAVAIVLFVFSSNSRAAQAGVLVVDAWLLVRGSRVPWLHAGALATAGLLLAAVAFSGQVPWAEKKLQSSVERALSVTDFSGRRAYKAEDLGDKGDNNRFRLVWWRAVARETLEQNPVFGLGFGYDLARGFVMEYEAGLGEDFAARSPHNIVFTLFGRLGLVGVATAGVVMIAMVRAAERSRQTGDDERLGLWCMAGVLAVAACFGVVLEGPMGALPFWTLAGIAYTPVTRTARPTERRSETERETNPPLPATTAGV